MSRDRLSGYVNPPPVIPDRQPLPETTLSLEGLFGGNVDASTQRIIDRNNSYIGNRKKVEQWFQPKKVTNSRMLEDFTYRGKTLTDPVTVLKTIDSVCTGFLNSYGKLLKGYGEDLLDIYEWGHGLLGTQHSTETIADRMLVEIQKHPLPLEKHRSVEFFNQRWFEPDQGFISQGNDNPSVDALPPIASADVIVKCCGLINDQLKKMDRYRMNVPMPGMKNPDLGPMAKTPHGSELKSQLDYTKEPKDQYVPFDKVLQYWESYHAKVLNWIGQNSKKTSMESLEDFAPMNKRNRLAGHVNPPTVSTEALNLAKYFDDGETNPADSDQRAALFGTCAGSGWRERLIPLLKCAHFNPVVDEWTKEAQAQEELVKRTASAMVFVITPMQKGFFSFVEITDLAIKDPKRLYLCFLDNDAGHTWAEDQAKSIEAIKGYLTSTCGMTIYPTLEDLAKAVNGEVQAVSESDTPAEGETISQEGLFDAIKKSSPVTPNRTA